MTTHSGVLAWRIPGMGEPGGLPSMGSHRVRHDWGDLAAAAARVSAYQVTLVVKNMPANAGDIEMWVPSLSWEDPLEEDREPASAFLPGELHGHSPWGHKESEMTERLTLSLSFGGTKIPYTMEQLDGRATTTESKCHSYTPCTERKDPIWWMKILCAATRTQSSQIKKWKKKKQKPTIAQPCGAVGAGFCPAHLRYIQWYFGAMLQILNPPASWKKLTVHYPWTHRPQTSWNQKVDDADSQWPHTNPSEECLLAHHVLLFEQL